MRPWHDALALPENLAPRPGFLLFAAKLYFFGREIWEPWEP